MKKITIIFLISMITSVSKGQVKAFDGFNAYDWNRSISGFDFISNIEEECQEYSGPMTSIYWEKSYKPEIILPIQEKYTFCNVTNLDEDYAYIADFKVGNVDYDFICDKEKNVDCKFFQGTYTLDTIPTDEGDNAFQVLSDMLEERYDIEISITDDEYRAVRSKIIYFINEDSFIQLESRYEIDRYDREKEELIYDEENLRISVQYSNYEGVLNFEEYIEDFIRRNRRVDLPL